MAHVQRRCTRKGCRRRFPPSARTCPGCGGRAARWYARYRGTDGKERSEAFGRKIDAEGFLAGQESRKRDGSWIDPAKGRTPLGDFYAEWIEHADLSPTTLDKYRRAWRLDVGPTLGDYPLAGITRADVREMARRAETRASAWQAAEALKLTRRLLNAAFDAEMIARNVAARIPLPRAPRKTITILKPEELHAAVRRLPERYQALALLGGYSGLRWSELVALKRNDIDLEARKVTVDERVTEVGGGGGAFDWRRPKTAGSARRVDLPSTVVKPLAEHLLRFPPLRSADPDLEGLMFYSAEENGPVRRHLFRREWRQACEAAGVPAIRLEWLRHTGASLAYAATRDMKAVAARLGHTSARMMDQVYVELYEEAGREMADAIDVLVRQRLAEVPVGES